MSNEQTAPLTSIDIHEALKALRAQIGTRAYISIGITVDELSSRKSIVSGCIYPDGITRQRVISVKGDDFSSVIADLIREWAEASADHERQMIRDMALEIIRITADMGACSDAALRAGKFSSADVIKYGGRACVEANEIASNGPFSITPIAAISNAA